MGEQVGEGIGQKRKWMTGNREVKFIQKDAAAVAWCGVPGQLRGQGLVEDLG
jgi:hypothetical protein